MNDNDKYWFVLYFDDCDDIEFTISQLVKDELDGFAHANKECGWSDDEIQVFAEEFIDTLIYELLSLKHTERRIYYRRKRMNKDESLPF